MPTVRNLSAGDIIPQMGFAPTQNQNGGWSATRDYYMLASTWESSAVQIRFAKGTLVATADPTIPSTYSFLAVESKVANYEDSGTVKLTVNYTGSASAQYGGENGDLLSLEAQPTYTLDGRLRDLPFSDHPKWAELTAAEKFALGELINGNLVRSPEVAAEVGVYNESISINGATVNYFTPATHPSSFPGAITLGATALEFADRISQGKSTYQAPTLTWTEQTQGNTGLTPAQLGKLGEISVPRGNPPTIPGYNWMLTGASQQQIGDLYQTTLEWTLSPPDGWDSFLYTFT